MGWGGCFHLPPFIPTIEAPEGGDWEEAAIAHKRDSFSLISNTPDCLRGIIMAQRASSYQ